MTKETVEIECRCKDCCHSELISTSQGRKLYCNYWDYETGMLPNEVDDMDFCSNGEV